ncbi:MAG TPA: hypothetical protein DEW35_01075 [Ruminococcaceae bacterium]|nr:hypothetical protein [Oscillospiraceae bacterium]
MDDLSAKLNEILSDEKSLNQFKALAENLLSSEKEEDSNNSDVLGISGDEAQKILGIFTRLKTRPDDKRTALLSALRPNLSPEKQKKVDTAIKLLKLIDMLPLLKESGILNLF